MGNKRKSKRKKKEAQTKLRQLSKSELPWWQSKATSAWQVCGGIVIATGALQLIWLLASGSAAVLDGKELWVWDQARLIAGYFCAICALVLGFGAYKGELLARLGSAVLIVCVSGGILALGISYRIWPMVAVGAVVSACSLLVAYLLALWQPK